MYRSLVVAILSVIAVVLVTALVDSPVKYGLSTLITAAATFYIGVRTGRDSKAEHKGPPARNPAEPPVRSVASDRDDWLQKSYVKTLEAANRDLISRAIDSDAKADEWHELSERYKRELKARAETVEISGLEEGTAFIAETRAAGPHVMPGNGRKTHYIGRDEDRASAFLSKGARVRMIRVWLLPDGRMAWRDREHPTLRIINQEKNA